MSSWLDALHDVEAALWLSDSPLAGSAGIRWAAPRLSLLAWHVGAGLVGTFLAGGLVAVLR